MIKCVWASIDENKHVSGGVAGDQNSREVKVGVWYNFGQTTVIRCKDRAKANIIATAAEVIANNPHVGYDQGGRLSLYNLLKENNWDYNKIDEAVETDCSALAAVTCNCAGIAIPGIVYSGNIVAACRKSGEFSILTASKYIETDDYLLSGDIIVAPNHHVIIVAEDGANAKSKKTSDNIKTLENPTENITETQTKIQ